MAVQLFIPKLGQTVEEVSLIGWLVEDGAQVEMGEEVLEVETDKAIFPVEAPARGVIHIGPFESGDVVPVLEIVAVIGKAQDAFAGGNMGDAEIAQADDAPLEVEAVEVPQAVSTEKRERVFASPRARKAAAKHGVDLTKVEPTGGQGLRVAERDVLTWLEKQPKAGLLTQQDVLDLLTKAGEASVDLPVRESVPLSGIRGVIAERMANSALLTARVTMFMDVDMTVLVAARDGLKMKADSEGWDFAPGYNDLIALAAAQALREHPYMNARLTADAIEHLESVNIGMAVDTERGLMVPVVHGADQLSLHEFVKRFRALIEQARDGRILMEDLTGGTFTITNLGMYDIKAFTPVINLPETAILGVGSIEQRPAAFEGELCLRYMMTLSLVFDHRVVDGAPAARFMQAIKSLLEAPETWVES